MLKTGWLPKDSAAMQKTMKTLNGRPDITDCKGLVNSHFT